MSRTFPAMAFFIATLTTIGAQDRPRGDMFVGYSYANANLGSGSKAALHGYEVSTDFNPLPWVGITIADDGHFGSTSVPFCFAATRNSCATSGPTVFAQLYTVSGGVRFSAHTGRFTPFVRALFGLATMNACPIQGCESKGAFAQAYGGGVDFRISERRLGWRLQGDFLQTRFFAATQNDARFSTGLLIFFYKHSH